MLRGPFFSWTQCTITHYRASRVLRCVKNTCIQFELHLDTAFARRHSAECIAYPHHTEIGTVSLSASSGRVSWSRWKPLTESWDTCLVSRHCFSCISLSSVSTFVRLVLALSQVFSSRYVSCLSGKVLAPSLVKTDHYTSTAITSTGPFYVKMSSHSVMALTTNWYPGYVPDHIKNLTNSSLVHSLPTSQILQKSTHNLSSCPANKQTDKHGSKHYTCQPVKQATNITRTCKAASTPGFWKVDSGLQVWDKPSVGSLDAEQFCLSESQCRLQQISSPGGHQVPQKGRAAARFALSINLPLL